MGYIRGDGRSQGTLFPVVLDDLIPPDHVCRVLDAFVDGLAMGALGFERAEAAETGRPGYDPRDLLKLYLYGYLHTIRSSRRLEAECRRNVELMWLLGRLYPDHKSIAEFRRMHRDAVTAAGAQLVRFAQSCGLIKGEWVAIDGTKFRAVSSSDSVRQRQALERYLDTMEQADRNQEQGQQAEMDPSAVQSALEKLKQHPEPEVSFMPVAGAKAPAYNVQTAVDAEHALIVTHAITLDAGDNRQLEPMAKAAQQALGCGALRVAADGGYSNGEQAARCEAAGILPHVPVKPAVNNQGDGTLFGREQFRYQPESDSFLCPANKLVRRKHVQPMHKSVLYRADPADCGRCAIKTQCTQTRARILTRLLDQDALDRMHQRATPDAMRLRRCTVELPFAFLKYRIFGHPRLLLRGTGGAQTEISLAVMAYNFKRMLSVLGSAKFLHQLTPA